MMRSKQAIQMPSSPESHEALTVWIISAIARGVYRWKGQKKRSMRNLDRLLQKRNGRAGFAANGALFIESLGEKTIFCASLARAAAGKRLRAVS